MRSHVAKNGIVLLLGTASTADYLPVSVEICSSVVGVASRPLAAGLRQFYTRRRFITYLVTAAVSYERRCSAHLFLVKVLAHHSAPSSAALAEGFRADCIQTSSPRVQVSTCLQGSAPAYLTDELCHVADVEARQRLRSSSSSSLIVSRTRLLTVGDRAFPVAAARVWSTLPDLFTSAPSVAVFHAVLA